MRPPWNFMGCSMVNFTHSRWGVASTIHPRLAPRLKEEKSYTYAISLDTHGLFYGEFYLQPPGYGVNHPRPTSAEVKGREELYLCHLPGTSWPVLGTLLPTEVLLKPLSSKTVAHSSLHEGGRNCFTIHKQQSLWTRQEQGTSREDI